MALVFIGLDMLFQKEKIRCHPGLLLPLLPNPRGLAVCLFEKGLLVFPSLSGRCDLEEI